MEKETILRLHWDKLHPVICPCGCENFRLIHKLAICPSVISPTLKPELIARPVYVCNDCAREYLFNPNEAPKS